MDIDDEAREALYRKIAEVAPRVNTPSNLRDLCEAWAWLRSPSSPHGGSMDVTAR